MKIGEIPRTNIDGVYGTAEQEFGQEDILLKLYADGIEDDGVPMTVEVLMGVACPLVLINNVPSLDAGETRKLIEMLEYAANLLDKENA